MIVRPMESWFRMLFIWNGSVLQTIIPQLVIFGALSTLAVFTHGRIFGEKIPLSTAPFTLFGLTLAVFLVFRNNASYARFTEGRLLWGNFLIAGRTLTSQLLCYVPQKASMADDLIAAAYALKHELRRTDPNPDMVRLLGPERAGGLHHKLYRAIILLKDMRGQLTGLAPTIRLMLDAQINELERCVGGCERLASTPIPFAYSVLLHRSVYAYCVLLPFGLVDSTEVFTPLICVFLSYTLIALEAIANEVADPFGMAPNALALDAMARTIERSILELCGRPVPEEIEPARPYQLT
jgi:putative membrane protein